MVHCNARNYQYAYIGTISLLPWALQFLQLSKHRCFTLYAWVFKGYVFFFAVDEVSNTLEHIKNTIDRCSTLAHKLNSLLIPREQQLEDFVICCKADSPDQDDSSVDLKDGDLTWSFGLYIALFWCWCTHMLGSISIVPSSISFLFKCLWRYTWVLFNQYSTHTYIYVRIFAAKRSAYFIYVTYVGYWVNKNLLHTPNKWATPPCSLFFSGHVAMGLKNRFKCLATLVKLLVRALHTVRR